MIVWIGLMGIILGSFVNALVWRLAQQAAQEDAQRQGATRKRQSKQAAWLKPLGQDHQRLATRSVARLAASSAQRRADDLSIVHGRSMCPSCRHTLAVKDLVPVLSWLSLRGRCRYCHKAISVQYPLVELLTGILFALAYSALHAESYGWVRVVYACIYTVLFVALALYDLRWFLLPDRLVFMLIGLATSQLVLLAFLQRDWALVGNSLWAVAIIFGLFWAIFVFSKGEWIGGGDVKLAIALGLIVGKPLLALLVIFIASLLGTLASVPVLVASKKKGLMAHIPFGPYLLAACFIVMLAGQRIVDAYQALLV